jgi:hypothetical protein
MGIIAASRLRASAFSLFIIEVDTSKAGSASDAFQFTGAEGDYDVVAKQNNTVVATFNDLSGQQTITLPSSGVYVLEVNAKEVNGFTGIRFNNSGDKLKLSKINQWGVFNDTRGDLFWGCRNLTEIASDVDWLNSKTNGINIFRSCSLTSLPDSLTLEFLNNGFAMFFGNSIVSLPSEMTLNNLITSTIMFQENNFTALPSQMNLTNLQQGYRMFRRVNLTDLPSGMVLHNLVVALDMFIDSNINTARYSQLLEDMEFGNSNNDVSFGAGSSKYNTDGQTARNLLTRSQNWTINDGGLE